MLQLNTLQTQLHPKKGKFSTIIEMDIDERSGLIQGTLIFKLRHEQLIFSFSTKHL